MPDSSSFPNEIFGFNFTEYLSVFVALIFALAVGEFFLSIGSLIRSRNRVTLYWEFILWLLILLHFFIIAWFTGWPRFAYLKLSLFNYFLIISPYLVIFAIVAVYFPDISSHKEINLKTHFQSSRKSFFILWAIYLIANFIIDLVMPTLFNSFTIWLEIVYILLLFIAAFYDKIWFRLLLALIMIADMVSALIYL
ncbi:MAG: hypothetical protein ACFHWX_16135 [Bacteroidota bacterium]